MKMRRLAVLLSGVVLIGAAGSGQGLPTAVNPPPQAPSSTKVESPKVPATASDAGAAAVDPKTYVIGPEDILSILVWREPDFSKPVAVRPDGKITMPLVGDLQAEGLTPERLSAQLKDALSAYINAPEVSVSVNQINSKKFFIAGQVNRPGQYPLVVSMTVFEALNAAGGFRDFANTKKIVVIRGNERIKFNYEEIRKGKNLSQNIELKNGDTISVP